MVNYFCDQPWKYRVINISQEWYKFCCVGPEITIKNISNIEQDTTLLDVKQSLTNNTPPEKCSYCFNLEDSGASSYRQLIGNTDKDKLLPGLAVVEINLENTCNLRCAMCAPKYSSRWTKNTIEVVDKVELLENVEHTINLLKDNSASLQRIIISGGEPSIIPNFYRLIQRIKETLPNNVWIYINTNGMFNERLGEKFLSTIDNLSQTHNVLIYWSCDGAGEVGEFLRDGLDYELFKKNLKFTVNNTKAKHTLQITTSHLNLNSQIDLIDDIFSTVGPLPVKRLYPVISPNKNSKQALMHPVILGKNILKVVSESKLKMLEQLCPEYAKNYKDFVNKISIQEPQLQEIQKSYAWFSQYAKDIGKDLPNEIVQHFKIIGAL